MPTDMNPSDTQQCPCVLCEQRRNAMTYPNFCDHAKHWNPTTDKCMACGITAMDLMVQANKVTAPANWEWKSDGQGNISVSRMPASDDWKDLSHKNNPLLAMIPKSESRRPECTCPTLFSGHHPGCPYIES